ncbi:cytochrome c biogenesis CcdA family protein [Verrucomicrobiota bacterium]
MSRSGYRDAVCAVLAGVLTYSTLIGAAAGATHDVSPVVIDYFYEPGCPDCGRVREQVLPDLTERFEGFYRLNRHDVSIKTNVIKLIAYQEALNITSNEPVMMVLDYRHVLNGFDAIKEGLFSRIDQSVAERLEPGWKAPEPVEMPQDAAQGLEIAQKRVRAFTMAAVLIAGLTDGINPCAIATLVFFMSLLGVSKVKGRGLLLMGVPFCLASFVTYTALGFGLLRVLHLLSGFETARATIEVVLMAVLVVLAVVSLSDAFRYRRTGNASHVALQLPASIKARIHKIMRQGMKARSLILGGLVVGTLVTALESVCTGQVYVPTLALVVKESGMTKAWTYLLLYNAMFIMPLVVVFILTYFGLRTETLIEWSKRNVVISKVLLGLFFAGMAILMLFM